MFFIKLTILYLLIYGILFLLGWCICDKICRGGNEEYKLILTPIIGIIPLSTLPIFFSFIGINTTLSAWITFVPIASTSLYQLIKSPFSFKKTGGNHAFLIIVIILAVFPSFSIIWKAGFLTSTLQSYSNVIVSQATFLLGNTIHTAIPIDYSRPSSNMLLELSVFKGYFGFFFLLASFSAILNIPPRELYLVLTGVASSFIPVSAYIACAVGFKLEKKISLIISLLLSINISYWVWSINGQLPIVLGINFLILSLGFLPLMTNCQDRRNYLLFAFILSALISNYFILIAYFIGAAILLILTDLNILRKSRTFIKNVGNISFLTLLLNPFPFVFILLRSLEFASITSKFTKNVPRRAYIEELLGFGPHFSMLHDGSFKYYLFAIFVIILAPLMFFGLYDRLKNKDRLFISIFTTISLLACLFALKDFTYHFYKNSVIGVFIIVCSLVIGGNFIYKKTGSFLIKQSVVATLIIFVLLNLNTYYKLSFLSSHPIISRSLIDLKNINKTVPANKPILVNLNTPTQEAWASFFLKNNKIKLKGLIEPWGFWILSPISGKPNGNFFYDYTKDKIDYTLSPKLQYETDIIETTRDTIVYENEEYFVSKNIPNPYLHKGWHNIAKNKFGLFRWTKRESSVLFNRPKKESILQIKASIPSVFKNSVEIQISINDKLIDKFSSEESSNINKWYLLNKYPLKKEKNILSINLSDTFSPNEMWGSIDLRRLGIMVYGINIFDLEDLKIDETIDIGRPEYNKYLQSGWSYNEVVSDKFNFAWVEGKNASLNVFVKDIAEMGMQFRARPFDFPGKPPQQVSIYANDNPVEKIKLINNNWSTYKIIIPSNVFKRGLNTIQFAFEHSKSPANTLKNNNDPRELSAAFDFIKFAPILPE